MKLLKRGLAVVGLLIAFSAGAVPVVTVNGTINWLGGNAIGNSIYDGFTTTEVDYIPFSIGGGLIVDIDVRSYERSSSPPFAEQDINGDGLIAYINPTIYLFRDDGALDLSDFTGQASEFSFDTFADGSINFLDPFLRVTTLTAGNYLLAIGSDDLSLESALTGRNTSSIGPIGRGDVVAAFGAYQVTVSAIPEPATTALLGAGLASMLAWRRRVKKPAA
jgi:hypothetical protein